MKITDLKDYKVLGAERTVLQETTPGIQKSKLQTATKVVGSIFPGQKVGEAIGTQIAKARATPEEREFITPGPTKTQVGADVANIGLNLATLGGAGSAGSFAQRVIKMAGLGAGLSGTRTASEGGNIEDVAKSATGGAVVGAALPVAGAGFRAVGRQIELLPSRFINSALGRSKQQVMADISKDKVDDFANYVLKSKPTMKTANAHFKDSSDSIEVLSKKVAESLSASTRQSGAKVTIGRNNLLDSITKTPEAEGALLNRQDIKNVIEKLAPQTKKLLQKESLTVTEANQLRQLVDKTLGDRAFLGGQLSSDKIVLKAFADTLREQVKSKAPEGTRALFSELSNEIRFRDNILNRIAQKQGNQVLSFGDFIGGGLGGVFGGGLPGAVAGVTARRAIESVPFKLTSAKLVSGLTKLEPAIQQMTPAQQTAILNFFSEIFSNEEKGQGVDPMEIPEK